MSRWDAHIASGATISSIDDVVADGRVIVTLSGPFMLDACQDIVPHWTAALVHLLAFRALVPLAETFMFAGVKTPACIQHSEDPTPWSKNGEKHEQSEDQRVAMASAALTQADPPLHAPCISHVCIQIVAPASSQIVSAEAVLRRGRAAAFAKNMRLKLAPPDSRAGGRARCWRWGWEDQAPQPYDLAVTSWMLVDRLANSAIDLA